jgi:hypothetical protein
MRLLSPESRQLDVASPTHKTGPRRVGGPWKSGWRSICARKGTSNKRTGNAITSAVVFIVPRRTVASQLAHQQLPPMLLNHPHVPNMPNKMALRNEHCDCLLLRTGQMPFCKLLGHHQCLTRPFRPHDVAEPQRVAHAFGEDAMQKKKSRLSSAWSASEGAAREPKLANIGILDISGSHPVNIIQNLPSSETDHTYVHGYPVPMAMMQMMRAS